MNESTDLMKVSENFPVGLKHAGLMIGDRMLSTKWFDDFLSFSHFVSGHAWKEMVFDLVVEAAVHEICNRVSPDTSSGNHLHMQVVQLVVAFQNWHALMVWGEDQTHV